MIIMKLEKTILCMEILPKMTVNTAASVYVAFAMCCGEELH